MNYEEYLKMITRSNELAFASNGLNPYKVFTEAEWVKNMNYEVESQRHS